MSAHSFRSVFMVASCAGAALGCYLVSLRVASERAALEDIETKIVLAQRDIRLLETEIDTRGRLAQLERWNVKVLALAAPSADQFLEGGFALARLTRPEFQAPIDAPVVLASAPAPHPNPTPFEEGERRAESAGATPTPAGLLRHASLKLPERKSGEAVQTTANAAPAVVQTRATDNQSATRPQPLKKTGDKLADSPAKPVTKLASKTKIDPLAPLPIGASAITLAKDSGTGR